MSESGARIQYEFGDFRLDLQQRLLLSGADGRPIPLSPKVFDTLLYFVERRGELLDKTTLLRAIWPNVVVEENSLNQNISALRRALGENPGEHRFFVTEPGRGYRFVADVRTLTIPARTPPQHQPAREASAARSTSQPTTPTSRSSIAVLPFANLTREPEKEYFSEGLAEELIHLLARVPGLKVPARTSSFAYKGRNVDIRQIARDLEVEVVLEGSVRSAGERIRVTAQLVDAQTGYHIWSETYDRNFGDLFRLQDELAGAVVQALKLTLEGSRLPSLAQAPPTHDIEAYQGYLQGRSLLGSQSREGLGRAMEMFQKAIARDPKFARAFSSIGMVHYLSVLHGFTSLEALLDSERAAQQALALDPGLAEAHALLAQINSLRGNWLTAEAYFRAALTLDENEASIHNVRTLSVGTTGHLREALRESEVAYHLAPASSGLCVNLSVWNSILGFDAEAVRYADLAIQLGRSPDDAPLPIIYSHAAYRSGRYLEAADHMAKMLPPEVRASGGIEVLKSIYTAVEDESRRAAAVEALRALRATAEGPKSMDSGFMIVLAMHWYTMLGAIDLAYDVANRALDQFKRSGLTIANWAGLWIPEMHPFRRDARFQTFATRLGIMDFWLQYGPPDDCELRNGKLICR
jgi:TolB-like protein